MKDLQDLVIVAIDDAFDDAKDLYFDDEARAIRHLVVDAGAWLSSHKLLTSPIVAGKPDLTNRLLPVALTREQVRNSLDIDMPITRQHQTDYSTTTAIRTTGAASACEATAGTGLARRAPRTGPSPAPSMPDRRVALTYVLRDTGQCLWRVGISHRMRAALASAA